MTKKHIRLLAFSAMFSALVFAMTWIAIPLPLGNINLGDCMVLLGAWLLGGAWSAVACAFGAALTDLLGGYAIYAPATFLIKALMVVVALLVRRITQNRKCKPVLDGFVERFVCGRFARDEKRHAQKYERKKKRNAFFHGRRPLKSVYFSAASPREAHGQGVFAKGRRGI